MRKGVASIAGILLASLLLSMPGLAAAANAPSLAGCKVISDDKARLACFDSLPTPPASAPVAAASEAAAPARARDATREKKDVRIAGISTNARGKLILTTVEDGTWIQLDDVRVASPPAPGASITIGPGIVGSHFCRLDARVKLRCALMTGSGAGPR